MNHDTTPAAPRRRPRDEGSMSLFYCVAALCIFVVIGLAADGGGALNAAAHADAVAQEAARAGGQQIDPGQAIPGKNVAVDPHAAVSAAQDYLSQAGYTGQVAVSPDGETLSVTVHSSYDTLFSSLIGISHISVTGDGTARLIHHVGA